MALMVLEGSKHIRIFPGLVGSGRSQSYYHVRDPFGRLGYSY